MKLSELKEGSGGEFPAYAWPGGYPIIYVVADGGVLCAGCANGENGSEARVDHEESQWRMVGREVYYEGPDKICTHCQVTIESAYGDPEEEND